MKRQDTRGPTLLQHMQVAEARAKDAMNAAKLAYNEAVAAYQAISIAANELDRKAPRRSDTVKCEECDAETAVNPFPEGWTQTGKAQGGGLACHCPAHS